MNKIVKFDGNKITKGSMVFDTTWGWLEVTDLDKKRKICVDINGETFKFGRDGREYGGEPRPSLVAMKIKFTKEMCLKEIEKIQTKSFEYKEKNWILTRRKGEKDWKIVEITYIESFGTNYYSLENVKKLQRMLNKSEE